MRRTLGAILLAYAALSAAYLLVTPIGQAPDESAHMRYIAWLTEHGRLPVFPRRNPGADYEFHQPPLYYLVSAPAYLAARGGGELARYRGVRAVNVLIGAGVVLLVFAFARAAFPAHPGRALGAAAFVAFLPMHSALAGSVTNDLLAEGAFAAGLWGLAVGMARGFGPKLAGLLGAVIGLGLLTKSQCVMLLPIAWLGVMATAPEGGDYGWRSRLRDAAVLTLAAAVVAGWWLARNQWLYGDPLAGKAFLEAFVDRPHPDDFMARYGLEPLSYVMMVTGWTFASFFGVFGIIGTKQAAFWPSWVYVALALWTLLLAVGLARWLRPGWTELARWQRSLLGVGALLLALVVASFVRFNLSFFQAQGRYLYPALPALALAACLGAEGWLPTRLRALGALALGLTLAVLSAVGLVVWIAPQLGA